MEIMEKDILQLLLSAGGGSGGIFLIYLVWNMNKKVTELCELIPKVAIMKEEISDLRRRLYRMEDRCHSSYTTVHHRKGERHD
jgi:hypothetical protein